ncbi:MAG: hypothetical protein KDA93_16685 [Planctomycetaceae bacterium]|nr:hypothetical protein [Planctomycetaceae bacterium]
MNTKKEYGDFQTPVELARRVVSLVEERIGIPDLVIEPNAGVGAFLLASVQQWDDQVEYEGYEINDSYVAAAQESLKGTTAKVYQRDFFVEDWKRILARPKLNRVLVLGNPPWVTNSDLGQLGSGNLPEKSNHLGLKGMDARTGKSNFDIAEWMLVRLIEALPEHGAIAMLCKTMTARRVLRHFWKAGSGREGSELFRIDAKSEFDVAVDACLFVTTGKQTQTCTAKVFSDLDTTSESARFGFINGGLVSDIDAYRKREKLDSGSSVYTWRSGIKHDAAKLMEFTRNGDQLINGFGESVDIEEDYVFPLLKSSDIGNGKNTIRKAVLVTQQHTGDKTSGIAHRAPKTWQYLMRHAEALDQRKSSIYKNRPRFSIFGVGPYSFSQWKVAISGLYKKMSFVLVPPSNERPVMVDDTCYFVPCRSQAEAKLLLHLLSSEASAEFFQSLVFPDSKRPMTIDLLRRLSFVELARELGRLEELQALTKERTDHGQVERQLQLVM